MKPSKSHSSVWTLNEVARPADGCHSGVEVAYKFRPLPVASMHFLSNRSEKPKSSQRLYLKGSASFKEWWLGRESNPRHEDFQSSALPTELPSLFQGRERIAQQSPIDKWDGGKCVAWKKVSPPGAQSTWLKASLQRTRPSSASFPRVSWAFRFRTGWRPRREATSHKSGRSSM